MEVSANRNTLRVVVDYKEYKEIFEDHDGEYVAIITNEENMEVFFPKWRDYTDKENILGTVHEGDALRFEKVEIIYNNPYTKAIKRYVFTVDDATIGFYPDVESMYDDLELEDFSHVPLGVTGFRVIYYFEESFF